MTLSVPLKGHIARLSKNTLIYGLGGVISRLGGFVLLPVLTAYLTPVDYGISGLLGWMAFLVTPVFSLGIGAACAPCYFKGNSLIQKEWTLWTAFTLLAISGLVLSVLGAVFREEISRLLFGTGEHGSLVFMSLMSTSLTLVNTPLMLYLQFEEKAKLFVGMTLIGTLLSIALTLGFVVFLGRGVRGLVEAGLLTQMANVILFFKCAADAMRFRFTMRLRSELLRLGIPLIPSFAFLFVLQHGNRYILQEYCGLDALGVYTVGFNLGVALGLLVSAFQSAWIPFFMSFIDRREEAALVFGRVLAYYFLSLGGLSLLFFIFAKPVVFLFTQPEYHESWKAVGLTAASQFMIGVFYILLPGMYFAEEVKYVSVVQGAAALLSLFVNFALIALYGLVGAGLGLFLGTAGMALFISVWNFLRKEVYVRVVYELRRIAVFSVFYLLCAGLTFFDAEMGMMAETGIILAETLLLVAVLFMLISPEERRSLRRLLGAVK